MKWIFYIVRYIVNVCARSVPCQKVNSHEISINWVNFNLGHWLLLLCTYSIYCKFIILSVVDSIFGIERFVAQVFHCKNCCGVVVASIRKASNVVMSSAKPRIICKVMPPSMPEADSFSAEKTQKTFSIVQAHYSIDNLLFTCNTRRHTIAPNSNTFFFFELTVTIRQHATVIGYAHRMT